MPQAQNPVVAYQGIAVELDAFFYDAQFNLTDPDAIPTYVITDPSNVVVQSGQGVKISLGRWKATFTSAGNAPLGNWTITWTATVASAPMQNNFEIFELAAAESKPQTQQVVISDEWLRQIKRVLAFPGVDNLLLDQKLGGNEELKEFVVWPALYEYFRRFPIEDRREYQTSSAPTELPFPDAFTFGATNIAFTNKFGATSTSASFWDTIKFQLTGAAGVMRFGRGLGSYGLRGNLNGMRQTFQMNRQVAQTYSNMYNTFKANVNEERRVVELYASVDTKIVIAWAKYSLNFADVQFTKLHNCIKLAQSFLLYHVADSTAILQDENLKKKINSEALKARADQLAEEVMKVWEGDPGAITLLRNF